MTNSTMTCEAFDEALPDYLEGTLDESLRPAVEGHLRECVRCTGLVKDLRSIEADAAKLPDLVPSRDLWQGIEARIAAPVIPLAARPERVRRIAPAWMGIAAAALIVSTAGITYTLTARSVRTSNQAVAVVPSSTGTVTPTTTGDSSNPETVNTQAVEAGTQAMPVQSSVPSPTRAAGRVPVTQSATTSLVSQTTLPSEAVYGREIAALQNIVRDRKTQLDSSTVAIIERNLQIIDRAIEQSKAALAKDPASRLLSDQLTHALDKKVELLRRAAMLPVNT
ncbi:MAG TPA: zf-HC2 domain-containing protein [Gemmatimonadaceae bacterium]|nr:zf-HC2 domain-containing protein [Gemmatimonadaceae bacterium]